MATTVFFFRWQLNPQEFKWDFPLLNFLWELNPGPVLQDLHVLKVYCSDFRNGSNGTFALGVVLLFRQFSTF